MEDAMVVFFVGVTVISIVAISGIKELMIKRAQIKADALVRAEEIKAKNQLEIEKLIHLEQFGNREKNFLNNVTDSGDDRSVREKANG